MRRFEDWLDQASERQPLRAVVLLFRGVWIAGAAIYATIAVGFILLLVGSLIVHGVEHVGRSFSTGTTSTAAEAAEGSFPSGPSTINPTPVKKNGELSYEFEPDDIDRAEEAPPSVRAYCAGAVSEAQEVGCLSHVEPSEVP